MAQKKTKEEEYNIHVNASLQMSHNQLKSQKISVANWIAESINKIFAILEGMEHDEDIPVYVVQTKHSKTISVRHSSHVQNKQVSFVDYTPKWNKSAMRSDR